MASGGYTGGFVLANGLVYGGGGKLPILPLRFLRRFKPCLESTFTGLAMWDMVSMSVADPSLEKDFLMLENTAGTWAYGLVRYDLVSYLPEAFLTMPALGVGRRSRHGRCCVTARMVSRS